ncbi:MAG: ATP synthase F1 subunit delta [Deltaproteobacteria bacterium]|nr:ATP synthase F1 subunit delta [Deltaproteobacteria bacterium]
MEKFVSLIAKRYANALFELAGLSGSEDEVFGDLLKIRDFLAKSPEVYKFLVSRASSKTSLYGIIERIGAEMGILRITRNFLNMLVEKRRFGELEAIVAAYDAKLSEKKSKVRVEVTAAREMDGETLQNLKRALEKGLGKVVSMDTRVDPSLVAGLTIRAGNRIIDASISNYLKMLRDRLYQASEKNQ